MKKVKTLPNGVDVYCQENTGQDQDGKATNTLLFIHPVVNQMFQYHFWDGFYDHGEKLFAFMGVV